MSTDQNRLNGIEEFLNYNSVLCSLAGGSKTVMYPRSHNLCVCVYI